MTVSCETCGKDFDRNHPESRSKAIDKMSKHLKEYHKEAVGIRARAIY